MDFTAVDVTRVKYTKQVYLGMYVSCRSLPVPTVISAVC